MKQGINRAVTISWMLTAVNKIKLVIVITLKHTVQSKTRFEPLKICPAFVNQNYDINVEIMTLKVKITTKKNYNYDKSLNYCLKVNYDKVVLTVYLIISSF